MDQSALLSFRSSDPAVASRWDVQTVAIHGTISSANSAPLDALTRLQEAARAARRNGRAARWSGFVCYETNRSIERLPPVARDDLTDWLPEVAFWPTAKPAHLTERPRRADDATIVARTMSRDAYLVAARRSIDYIAAGDVFQVNLAHGLDVRTPLCPTGVWHRLSAATPSTYGALIEMGGGAIVSNSPELFFRIEPLSDGRRRITTRPIKGTRPRGPGMREALERSEKDKAELAMIVDLSRNDLGRVCEIGSVRVVEPRVIEELPTLYHGVATVEGMLRPDATLADVFRAMFPCGSITGCPKVRAMEIIDELECQPRGPYCGAIGYVDSDGNAEFSVAIRTMTMRDGVARVSVGGGIVADSDPEDEYRETIDKARAMLAALGVPPEEIDALRNG